MRWNIPLAKAKAEAGTHTGNVRAGNEDCFFSDDDIGLWLVADGMGGHKGGEVASQMTVSHITDAFKQADKAVKPIEFLEKSIQRANQLVVKKGKENKELEGMGTTIVCILMTNNIAHIAHVGDSRLYIFRYNKPYFVTKDHSVVQDLLDKGLITAKEAENHPNKNRILQAIGTGNITPSITIEKLYKGDSILLCSDGLTGEVKVNNIYSVIKANEPVVAAKRLIARANKNGGSDNITAIVIKVDKGPMPPPQPKIKSSSFPVKTKKSYRFLFSGVLIGVLITTLIGFSYWWKVVKIPPPPPKIDSLTIATPDSIKPEPDELQIKKTPEVEPAEDKKENVDVNGDEAAGINDTGSIKSAKLAGNDDTEPEPKDTEIKNDTTKLEQPEEINQ